MPESVTRIDLPDTLWLVRCKLGYLDHPAAGVYLTRDAATNAALRITGDDAHVSWQRDSNGSPEPGMFTRLDGDVVVSVIPMPLHTAAPDLLAGAAPWVQTSPIRWERTVDGVVWSLEQDKQRAVDVLDEPYSWYLSGPVCESDPMGPYEVRVQLRANESIAAWVVAQNGGSA